MTVLVQIRDVDPDVRDELKARASKVGMSLNAYLKDVLQRLPTQAASKIEELLPHRWKPLAVAN